MAYPKAVGQRCIHGACEHQTQQDRQSLGHSACINRDDAHTQNGDDGHGGIEALRARRAANGDRSKVQTDDDHHRAGHNRGHQRIDPGRPIAARIGSPHHQADRAVERSANDDSAQCHADIRVRAAARVAGNGNHATDKSETRAQVTWHPPAHHHEKNQRSHAGHQNGDIGIETDQQRRKHRRPEHGDHMLRAHRDIFGPRQTFIGSNHHTWRTIDAAPLRKIGHIGD
jgi:hypothetical protein